MQQRRFLAGLVFVAIVSLAAKASAEPWDAIDLATLPDKPDPSGNPGWYYRPDLPAMAQVPPHPEYGTLTALIPQRQNRILSSTSYRPTYVSVRPDVCAVIQTIILEGDYGPLLADVTRNPPPMPPGSRGIWFAGPEPRIIRPSPSLVPGYEELQQSCTAISQLARTVDEEDNLVAAFDVLQVPKAIEKAAFQQMIPPTVGVATPDPAPEQNLEVVEDRLDLTGDVVSQFVEYAAALGIAEQDITGSIFSGDFVPDPDDLRLVLLRLGGVDCVSAFAAIIEDPNATLGQVQNFDCSLTETARPGPHHDAWNSRFGTPGDEHLFILASRLYYLMTRRRPDPRWVNQTWPEGATSTEAKELMAEVAKWSAPYHFLWSDRGNPRRDLLARYEEMRAVYLSGLPERLSAAEQTSLGLLGDSSAVDAAGPDWPGTVLALFLHGDWNRIDWMWRAHLVSANGLQVTNWKQSARLHSAHDQRGFADIAAQWALARHAALGDCGDPVTTMIHTSTPVTDWYRGRMFEGREYGHPSVSEFTALAAFSDILIAAPATVRADIARFERIAVAMGCDSAMRRAMENNMIAYFEGRAPVLRSGL